MSPLLFLFDTLSKYENVFIDWFDLKLMKWGFPNLRMRQKLKGTDKRASQNPFLKIANLKREKEGKKKKNK